MDGKLSFDVVGGLLHSGQAWPTVPYKLGGIIT